MLFVLLRAGTTADTAGGTAAGTAAVVVLLLVLLLLILLWSRRWRFSKQSSDAALRGAAQGMCTPRLSVNSTQAEESRARTR